MYQKLGQLRQDESGQMAVELVVCMPVILIMALVIFNLAQFVVLCSRFDRLAFDAVVAHGVSPAKGQTNLSALEQVEKNLQEAFGHSRASIEVTQELLGVDEAGIFAMGGQLVRYTCVLKMSPWPSHLTIGNLSLGAPQFLQHERSLVINRYRPAVVV